MPQTENTPNLEMRTCVTCGKSFYVNLDDEKIRAANGIAPRRECYNCLCARTQFIEQRAKAEQESDIMRLFKKFISSRVELGRSRKEVSSFRLSSVPWSKRACPLCFSNCFFLDLFFKIIIVVDKNVSNVFPLCRELAFTLTSHTSSGGWASMRLTSWNIRTDRRT